jgi:hypothetical protein
VIHSFERRKAVVVLCFIKNHTVKTYEEVEVWLCAASVRLPFYLWGKSITMNDEFWSK